MPVYCLVARRKGELLGICSEMWSGERVGKLYITVLIKNFWNLWIPSLFIKLNDIWPSKGGASIRFRFVLIKLVNLISPGKLNSDFLVNVSLSRNLTVSKIGFCSPRKCISEVCLNKCYSMIIILINRDELISKISFNIFPLPNSDYTCHPTVSV